MAELQTEKKFSAFCSGMRKLKSLQYFSKMQPFFKHERILYILQPLTKKSTLRHSSYKSTVLTIFQFKEVPFLRFKLLAFLSLSAQAFFPLRQQGTQKKQDILAANREAQWKFCSHAIFAQTETEPNFRSNQDFLKEASQCVNKSSSILFKHRRSYWPFILCEVLCLCCKTGMQEVSSGTWPSQPPS